MGISGTEGAYTAAAIGGDATNGLDVDVTRSALPAGASTSAKQDTAQTALDAIAASVAGTLTVATHAVTGTVTANAGTNLNTSALALEAGGNLATAVASLSVLDDWDESDRAKINPIVGQAGVQGGSGSTNALTQRVVLATDVALPAGTNAIGKLAANSGVDIGDVDVTSLPNVTLAAGTNTNEVVGDVAHDAVAAGNPLLQGGYASAAAPSDVSADGDAVRTWHLRNGSQVVNLAAAGALIGATSNALDVNIKSGAGSGGTALADDAAFTVAVTSFTPCGGIVTADSVDSGDGGAFAMLANRQQKVTLYDSGGVELAVGGGTQYTEDAAAAANPVGNALILIREDGLGGSLTTTDGDNVAARGNNKGELYVKHTDNITVNSHAVTNAGTFAVQASLSAAVPAGTNNIGDVDVLTVPADPFGANADAASATGSISAKLRFIAGTGIPITGTVTVGSHAVTNAGTFAVQAATAGIAADDAAASGNPVLNAGFAIQTDGTDPGAVSAEGDVTTLRTDMQRNLLVNLTNPRCFDVSADYASAQTNTSVKAAPGANLSIYITDLVISNGATAGNITLLDGSGGTVKFELYPAINGGVSMSFRNPIRLTANTALCITSTTVTTHSINVCGYIAP